jgi:hypothetical protein
MLDYSGNTYFTTVKNVGPYSYLFGDYIVNVLFFYRASALIKKKRNFSSYIRKFREIGCTTVIYD